MSIIKNKRELLEARTGKLRTLREKVLEILEEGIRAANPYEAVKRYVKIEDGVLKVENVRIRLGDGRIAVFAFGKASIGMCKALVEILGEYIDELVISAPKYSERDIQLLKGIKGTTHIFEGGHPLPNENSLKAARKALEIAEDLKEKDLAICLISGGGSALFETPLTEDITIDDLKELNRLLINCGASIDEINIVRKHISAVKGGKLAKVAYPARVISLIISDVVGDDLSTIASGPTAPDAYTFEDAYRVLSKYHLLDKVPNSIIRLIKDGLEGKVPDTVKPYERVWEKVLNLIVASNIKSLLRMRSIGEKLGFNTIILSDSIEGEAREVGKVFAAILISIRRRNFPLKPPAVILAGGETTVTVKGKGKGGRNQELALSLSIKISGLEDLVFASMGTDGIDGNSDAAGAIVDGETYIQAGREGLDPFQYLENNDSYTFFKKLGGSLIFTGYTGTNVNDIMVGVVG